MATVAATVPSAGRQPVYLRFEKIAAHAALPHAGDCSSRDTAATAVFAAAVAATDASAARRAGAPVSAFLAPSASWSTPPAGRVATSPRWVAVAPRLLPPRTRRPAALCLLRLRLPPAPPAG
eukprot:5507004-Pleurochrysis_carterae.AAC.2